MECERRVVVSGRVSSAFRTSSQMKPKIDVRGHAASVSVRLGRRRESGAGGRTGRVRKVWKLPETGLEQSVWLGAQAGLVRVLSLVVTRSCLSAISECRILRMPSWQPPQQAPAPQRLATSVVDEAPSRIDRLMWRSVTPLQWQTSMAGILLAFSNGPGCAGSDRVGRGLRFRPVRLPHHRHTKMKINVIFIDRRARTGPVGRRGD